MPRMVRVLFQSARFHHQPHMMRPPLVHSIHLWHQQCWTRVVLFSALMSLGAQYFHDSACRPCAKTVAHNYTCKIGLALWVFWDPLLDGTPYLYPCDSHALLLAWSHPRLFFRFCYSSPARRIWKGRVTYISIALLFLLFPGVPGQCRQRIAVLIKGGWLRSWISTAIFSLSLWLVWRCIHGYHSCDTLYAKSAIQFSVNHYDNEAFGKVYERTPITGLSVESKIFRFDRKEIFTMPTMHGIYQLMIFPDNLQKQRKKSNPRIKTTDPEKLFPEAGGRRVSRSSVFGQIHKCLFWQEGALCRRHQCR